MGNGGAPIDPLWDALLCCCMLLWECRKQFTLVVATLCRLTYIDPVPLCIAYTSKNKKLVRLSGAASSIVVFTWLDKL